MQHLGGQRKNALDAQHLEAQGRGTSLTDQALVRSSGHAAPLVLRADGALKLRWDEAIVLQPAELG